jgi:hypothetical protein
MADLTDSPATVQTPTTAAERPREAAETACCQDDAQVDCCGGVTSLADGCGCGAA